jgi:hypothetical protein
MPNVRYGAPTPIPLVSPDASRSGILRWTSIESRPTSHPLQPRRTGRPRTTLDAVRNSLAGVACAPILAVGVLPGGRPSVPGQLVPPQFYEDFAGCIDVLLHPAHDGARGGCWNELVRSSCDRLTTRFRGQ